MQNQQITPGGSFRYLLFQEPPQAIAWVAGGSDYPDLSGLVSFYATPAGGVLIMAEFFNLPNAAVPNSSSFYGFHIHENGDCSHSFTKTGEHYNPGALEHPEHAGDLPPLLGNHGYAWTAFYDKRFLIRDIIGRSVVVHSAHDDFTSQPSGNSGTKIACGVIRPYTA